MRFATFKVLTRIELTVFALPFIVAGASLALSQVSFSWIWLLILPAFFLARISGMAFNQLIDRHIDALNPRTKNRPLPSGRASVKEARIISWSALVLFMLICLGINPVTSLLGLAAAFLISIYSYTKRVHYTCHFVLGTIHFLGPVTAYAALTGSVSIPSILLGVASGCLIAGNDIAYAIQDYEFDRDNALFSIPARFGIDKSLLVVAFLHIFYLLTLILLGLAADFFPFYYLILPAAALIFVRFHFFMNKRKHTLIGIEPAFFTCTVAISFLTLFFIVSAVVWHVMF